MRRSRVTRFQLGMIGAGIEAQQVIALRLAKLALGGAPAKRESQLMVDEKVSTLLSVQQRTFTAMMTGGGIGAPQQALNTYRRAMRANRRRLLRGG